MREGLANTIFSPDKLFMHQRILELYENGKRPSTNKLMQIYPIALEIGPSGKCNNGCAWCNHKEAWSNNRGHMDFELYKKLVDEVSNYEDPKKRSKAVIYSASGEPTINPDFSKFVKYTSESDLESSLITNGTALYGKKGNEIQECMIKYGTWMRISLNAGNSKTRSKIHKTGPNDFNNILEEIKNISKIRDNANYIEQRKNLGIPPRLHLGVQIVMEPQNIGEINSFVRQVYKSGADYAQIKPVILGPEDSDPIGWNMDRGQLAKEFWEKVIIEGREAKKKYASDNFEVFFKEDQFGGIISGDRGRSDFKRCRAVFAPIIEADGEVYHCSQTRGKEKFFLGNLKDNTFQEIWESDRRKKVIAGINMEEDCQIFCRNHSTNSSLEEADKFGFSEERQIAVKNLINSGGKGSNFV